MAIKVSAFVIIILATLKVADSIRSLADQFQKQLALPSKATTGDTSFGGTSKLRGVALAMAATTRQPSLGQQHPQEIEPVVRRHWPWLEQHRQRLAWERLVKVAHASFLVQNPKDSNYCAEFPAEVYAVHLEGKLTGCHGFRKSLLSTGFFNACFDLTKFLEEMRSLMPDMIALKVLYLGHNNIGDGGAHQLAVSLKYSELAARMTELHLGSNEIGLPGIKDLAGVLRWMTKLRVLKLYGNKMGDDGVEQLAAALPGMPGLKTLDLSNNEIGDKGVEKLAEALPKISWHTQILDLTGNKAVVWPAETLSEIPGPQELDLSDNNIEDKGAEMLAAALPEMPGLQILDLSHNLISNVGAEKLLAALPDSIKFLYLIGNRLGDGCKAELAAALQRIPHLKVYLFGNKFTTTWRTVPGPSRIEWKMVGRKTSVLNYAALNGK